jgi:hypothetical protein
MPSKADAVAELAEELIRLLVTERSLRPSSYPLTVHRLIEMASGSARPAQIARAMAKRSFQKHVVFARARNQDAPIALLSDLESFAGSRPLLEFMLQSLRTSSNQAFSAAQLKVKTSRKLQQPFQAALVRQIEGGSLPPTVGWITINRTKKLFLLADLHLGGQESNATTLRSSGLSSIRSEEAAAGDRVPITEPGSRFVQAFDRAFDELDRRAGAHNFVSLADLRTALPMPRQVFDRGLQDLRLAGRYGLSAAEGRHGLTLEERDAAIMEDGTLLLYVSRKTP